mmetsp:Transcript_7513/g.30535  ORF Transcript_7513/g.30535 Transcript_7513/m.30535 type:complete len:290 (+) Transcript_7513:1664-2533(+)
MTPSWYARPVAMRPRRTSLPSRLRWMTRAPCCETPRNAHWLPSTRSAVGLKLRAALASRAPCSSRWPRAVRRGSLRRICTRSCRCSSRRCQTADRSRACAWRHRQIRRARAVCARHGVLSTASAPKAWRCRWQRTAVCPPMWCDARRSSRTESWRAPTRPPRSRCRLHRHCSNSSNSNSTCSRPSPRGRGKRTCSRQHRRNARNGRASGTSNSSSSNRSSSHPRHSSGSSGSSSHRSSSLNRRRYSSKRRPRTNSGPLRSTSWTPRRRSGRPYQTALCPRGLQRWRLFV